MYTDGVQQMIFGEEHKSHGYNLVNFSKTIKRPYTDGVQQTKYPEFCQKSSGVGDNATYSHSNEMTMQPEPISELNSTATLAILVTDLIIILARQ